MAKEHIEISEPVTFDKPQQPHIVETPVRSDTKIVVIAVGASVVLFIIGLILGYILGHQIERGDHMRNATSRMQQGMFRRAVQPQTTVNTEGQ